MLRLFLFMALCCIGAATTALADTATRTTAAPPNEQSAVTVESIEALRKTCRRIERTGRRHKTKGGSDLRAGT